MNEEQVLRDALALIHARQYVDATKLLYPLVCAHKAESDFWLSPQFLAIATTKDYVEFLASDEYRALLPTLEAMKS